MKVITLILSCLLLVGAAVGVTAFAADSEPEAAKIEIAKKNIAYEGAIQMLYLVDANDAAKALGSVKVVFGADVAVGDDVTGLTVKEDAGDFPLEGKTYDTVYSNGIVAKEYRKELKATPVIVGDDGLVKVVGEAVSFNVYEYAMSRFDGAYTAAQLNLYKALLDYGAAVQDVLGYTDETVKALGGWADEYYKLSFNGGAAEIYRPTAFENGYDFSDKINAKFSDELVFAGFAEAGGAAIAAKGDSFTLAPGNIALNERWLSASNYTKVNGLFNDFNNQKSTGVGNGGEKIEYTNADSAEDDKDNYYINYNETNTRVYFSATDSNYTVVSDNAPGTKYVFEADFTYRWSGTRGDAIAYLGFSNIGDDGVASMAEYYALSDTDNAKAVIFGQDFVRYTPYKLRLEHIVGETGMHVYIDGDYKGKALPTGTNSGISDSTVDLFHFDIQVEKMDLKFDNVYCGIETSTEAAAEYVTLNATHGTLAADRFAVAANGAYTLPIPDGPQDETVKFLGWYDSDDNAVAQSGTWTLPQDSTLTAKWYRDGGYVKTEYGIFNDFNNKSAVAVGNGGEKIEYANADSADDDKDNYYLNYNETNTRVYFSATDSDYTLVSGNAAGIKYVFEADFTYRWSDKTGENLAYLGFSNIGNDGVSSMAEYYALNADSENATVFGQTFKRYTSYKLRLEYTVGKTGMDVYIDGDYKGNVAPSGTNDNIDPTAVDLFQFDIQVEKMDLKFDNVYCGIEKPQIIILENP